MPATTRAVNAEAFEPCSACRMRSTSIRRAAVALGALPVSICRKLAACERRGSGAGTARPRRIASCAATIIGTCDVRRTPFRSVASGELSAASGSKAASADTAVRSTSIGCASLHRADDVENAGGQAARGLQLGREGIELGARRQLALEQQVAGFLERRALREVVDRVAAIEKLARAPVDEAHARAVEMHALQAAMDLDLLVALGHAVPSPARSPRRDAQPLYLAQSASAPRARMPASAPTAVNSAPAAM